MKKNNLKLFCTMVMALVVTFSTFTFVNANSYIPSGLQPGLPSGESSGKVQNLATSIIGTLMWAGYAIAIGMIIFIGIKYVMASADEKASMKGMLVKVIIGGIIIVASTTIVNAVLSIATT